MIRDDEIDNQPSADPDIQINYEKAAGRFLVAFNRLDNELGQLIAMALNRAGRPDLIERYAHKSYSQKIDLLDLFSILPGQPRFETSPFQALRSMGGERNKIAHGHFDQNPYDGSYTIKDNQGPKRVFLESRTIDAQTERCTELWHRMRFHMAAFWFESVVIVEPEP